MEMKIILIVVPTHVLPVLVDEDEAEVKLVVSRLEEELLHLCSWTLEEEEDEDEADEVLPLPHLPIPHLSVQLTWIQ